MDTYIIVFICGILFTGVGIGYTLWMNQKIKVCKEYTDGFIIENQERGTGHRNRRAYFPIFSIVVNGTEYKLRHYSGSNPPKYKIGDKETVYYNPNKPEQFYIKEKFPFKVGLIIILFGIGTIVLSKLIS